MDININTLGDVYRTYLENSSPSEGAYAMEVFYDLYSGAIPREVIERTRGGLCLDIVKDFIWAGLMSLKA